MTTPAERQRAYRARIAASEGRVLGPPGRPRLPVGHGNATAWRRHQRDGDGGCDECRAWRAEYMRGLRAR